MSLTKLSLEVASDGSSAKVMSSDGVSPITLLEFDATGKVVGGNISDEVLKPSFNATGMAPMYACRAWANANGTGTVALRANGNMSSIVDNGVGDYSFNLAVAMPDVSFSAPASAANTIANPGDYQITTSNASTTEIRARVYTTGTASVDPEQISLSVFR